MLIGILVAIGTGLIWSTVGIVMSFFSRSKVEIAQYFLTNYIFSGILAVLLYCDFGIVFSGQVMSPGKLCFFMIASGATNSVGMFMMQSAMKRGHNSVAWSIGQSALIIPFFTGVLIYNQGGTMMKFIGVGLIISGMLLPLTEAKKNSNNQKSSINWLFFALGAFLLFGTGQTLSSIPSYWTNWSDNAQLRPSLPYLGSIPVVIVILLVRKKKFFDINKKTVLIAAAMSVLNVISVKMLFFALDRLSACGIGAIGFPVTVGSCISGFSIYSLIVIKEKSLAVNWLGLAGTVGGIIVLSIR